MRRTLTVTSAVAIAALTLEASAEHCTPPEPAAPRRLGLSVGASGEFATYRTARYEGEYQGLALRLGWQHRWLRLHAGVPAFRINRNGRVSHGLGDVFLEAAVPLARTVDEALVGGVAVAAMMPTGDPMQDLGMGHVMLMPGAWATWHNDRAFVSAQASYGRAMADGGAHHGGGGLSPLVNPMNSSEIEFALSGGVSIVEPLRIRGGVYGAVPVAVPEGTALAAADIGLDMMFVSGFSLSSEAHLPLAGSPFLAKFVLMAGARF